MRAKLEALQNKFKQNYPNPPIKTTTSGARTLVGLFKYDGIFIKIIFVESDNKITAHIHRFSLPILDTWMARHPYYYLSLSKWKLNEFLVALLNGESCRHVTLKNLP